MVRVFTPWGRKIQERSKWPTRRIEKRRNHGVDPRVEGFEHAVGGFLIGEDPRLSRTIT